MTRNNRSTRTQPGPNDPNFFTDGSRKPATGRMVDPRIEWTEKQANEFFEKGGIPSNVDPRTGELIMDVQQQPHQPRPSDAAIAHAIATLALTLPVSIFTFAIVIAFCFADFDQAIVVNIPEATPAKIEVIVPEQKAPQVNIKMPDVNPSIQVDAYLEWNGAFAGIQTKSEVMSDYRENDEIPSETAEKKTKRDGKPSTRTVRGGRTRVVQEKSVSPFCSGIAKSTSKPCRLKALPSSSYCRFHGPE